MLQHSHVLSQSPHSVSHARAPLTEYWGAEYSGLPQAAMCVPTVLLTAIAQYSGQLLHPPETAKVSAPFQQTRFLRFRHIKVQV